MTHKFLAWAGPSVVIFLGACLGLIFSAATIWPGVKSWTEDWFVRLEPVLTAPWFLLLTAVLILGYIAILVMTSADHAINKTQRKSLAASDPVKEAIHSLGENPLGEQLRFRKFRGHITN